jgi:predicted MFS family arabinose efflux permease
MRTVSGWAAVVLVGLGAVVAQAFGRFTYSVLLPAIRNDLDHSNTVAGLLGTTNVLAYLVGTFVVASLTTRFPLLTVLRTGFAFSLGGIALAAVAPNVFVLSIALFSMGFGGALIWVPSPAIAAAAVGPHQRGLAVGTIGGGVGFGIVVSGQLARVVRDRSGDSAWRDVYRIDLVLGIVVAIILLLRHSQNAPSGQPVGGAGFGVLRKMPGWIPITGAYITYGFSYLIAISFLTSRLEDDAGFSEGLASTMFTLVGIGAILGGVMMGVIAGRIGERRTLVTGYVLFAIALAGILTGVVGVVAASSVVIGLMFGGLPSVIIGYVVRNTSPEAFGPSFAAATFAFGGAQVTSPQLGGLIADITGGFTLVFVVAIGFALAGAATSSRLPT